MLENLTRNKDAVFAALHKGSDGSLMAKEPLNIIFPARYEESDLAFLEGNVYVLGIFAIQVGNHYAVNNMPAKVRLFPSEITTFKHNDQEYYNLSFDKGGIVTDNINVVTENTLGYYIYRYFIALGRVPFYMNAMDMVTLFHRMREYTTVEYGVNHAVCEMIVSMIMRDPENIQKYWRQSIHSVQDLTNKKPDFVPLRDIPHGARNTTAKLLGSYSDEGLNSALLHPSDTAERVETLLRQ